MKMFGSVLRRIMLGLGIAILLLTVGVGLYTYTDHFRNLLRDQLVQALNIEFQGIFGLERVVGSIWGDLILEGLSVRYAEREVIAIPRVGIRYALWPFLQGQVEIRHIEAFSPIVKIKQSDDNDWDVVDAFASRAPAPEPSEPSTLAILLPTILLHEAEIEVSLANGSGQTLHFTQANLDLGLKILPDGTEAEVRQLTAQLTTPDVPPLHLDATLAYQDTATPATLSVTAFDVHSAASSIQLTGGIPNFAPLTVDATLALKKLAATDLHPFLPGVTLNTDISGTVQIRGPQNDLTTHVMLSAGKAQVTADVRADLSQAEPHYTGTVQIAQLDPRKLLGPSLPAGVIVGTLGVSGVGSSLANLHAQADLHVAALQVETWQLGNVSVSGSVANKRAKLHGEVHGGLGLAAWDGTLDLLEKPRYELNLRVDQLNLQQVSTRSTGQEAMTGQLTLSGRVKGEGFKLPDINTQIELEIQPSTIGPVRIAQGRLVGTIAQGRIHIADTRLIANDTVLAVSGELGTAVTQTGQLSYHLDVGNVAPWLSLAGQQGQGSLSLKGQIAGTLAAMQTSGTLEATGLNFGKMRLKDGQLTFAVETKKDQPPQGKLTAQLSGLTAGIELRQVHAEVTSQPGASPSAQIDLSAQDATGRAHALNANFTYQPDQLSVQLNTLRLSLPNGTWQLPQAARLVQRPTGISVEHFVLENGSQQLLLDGSYATTGAQNIQLQIKQFALTSLHPIVPQSADISGFVSAHIQIAGTAVAPQISGTTEFSSLRIAGQEYAGLSAQIAYTNSRATTELTFQQDAAHALQASGSLPLALQWASGFEARPLGDIDLKIHSTGINLAVLNAFSGKAVTGIAGQFLLDISLQGPLSDLRPHGTFQIRDGQVELKPLGVQISTISLEGGIEPGAIRIGQLLVKSGKGTLNGSGTIALQGYTPHGLSLALSADRWPAIKTRQYNVRVGADLRCEGQLSAPHISGRLDVLKATLRPDLAFLTEKPISRDTTITVIQSRTSPQASEADQTANKPAQANPPLPLTLDLRVQIHRNTRIVHQNASIELAGNVHVTQQTANKPVLIGSIETVRGWAGFKGRRFTLQPGEIVFTGGTDINPRLDLNAQARVLPYTVKAHVGGTANEPTLNLSSEPGLDQADILAVMLFGKPPSQLGQGQQVSLQDQALKITGGYAAARISESVTQALGLEELGIDLRDVDYSGDRVGYARSLTDRARVSVSQGLTTQGGREVAVEYDLAPGWNLSASTTSRGSSAVDILWQKRY